MSSARPASNSTSPPVVPWRRPGWTPGSRCSDPTLPRPPDRFRGPPPTITEPTRHHIQGSNPMSGSLILHRGAREAPLDQIARVAAPSPTDTWYPIPHVAVLEAVEETLAASAFGVRSRRLALSANDRQFFATLDLFAPIGHGVALSVGIRNSIDKTNVEFPIMLSPRTPAQELRGRRMFRPA